MQESLSNSIPSDSLMQEGLVDYSKGYSQPAPDSGQSGSFSFNSLQKKVKPYKDTIFEASYNKLEIIKNDFYKERNALIQKFNLQQFNREVIKSFLVYEDFQSHLKQQQKKKKQIQDENQAKKQQCEKIRLQNVKKTRQKQIYEQVAQFQSKLKEKFNQQKLFFKSQEQIKQELTRVLTQNLNKRSQQTLNKLKPYLEHSIEDLKQNNQILSQNKQFLTSQQQKYEQKMKSLLKKDQIQKQRMRKYEIKDQIQDQKNLASQIKKIQSQSKKDAQIQMKKVAAFQN